MIFNTSAFRAFVDSVHLFTVEEGNDENILTSVYLQLICSRQSVAKNCSERNLILIILIIFEIFFPVHIIEKRSNVYRYSSCS